MEWRWDKKEDQAGVDPNEPGTTPLTRVVRKIFNAFKLGPVHHSEEDSSMANDYNHSPLGIPIPFRKARTGPEGQGSSTKEAHKEEPKKQGSHNLNRKRMLKE